MTTERDRRRIRRAHQVAASRAADVAAAFIATADDAPCCGPCRALEAALDRHVEALRVSDELAAVTRREVERAARVVDRVHGLTVEVARLPKEER